MQISIIKMVNQRNALLEELRKIKTTLEQNPHQTKNLSKRAREIVSQLDEIEKILKENATFQTNEFADFIRNVFILSEDGYELTRITRKNSNEKYYIISDKATQEFLQEEIRFEKDLDHFLQISKESQTVVLSGETTYPFKENLKMDSRFSKHKKLRIAIYNLIQLKLDQPDISDEERYKQALNILLRNNLKESYYSSFKKNQ